MPENNQNDLLVSALIWRDCEFCNPSRKKGFVCTHPRFGYGRWSCIMENCPYMRSNSLEEQLNELMEEQQFLIEFIESARVYHENLNRVSDRVFSVITRNKKECDEK